MAQRTNQRTWAVRGTDADIHISEITGDHDPNQPLTYEEAKARALAMLNEHVAPYLERICALASDHDLQSGTMPRTKAWVLDRPYCGNKVVVIASTKAQAAKLAHESRYGFNKYYELATGDWWYELAHKGEGIWIEKQGENKKRTGHFVRPLDQAEGDQILQQTVARFQAMSIERLNRMIGRRFEERGQSSTGTPYKVIITIKTYSNWEPNKLFIAIDVDDGLDWGPSRRSEYICRQLPNTTVDWKREGF
jgi:hypothetical protein